MFNENFLKILSEAKTFTDIKVSLESKYALGTPAKNLQDNFDTLYVRIENEVALEKHITSLLLVVEEDIQNGLKDRLMEYEKESKTLAVDLLTQSILLGWSPNIKEETKKETSPTTIAPTEEEDPPKDSVTEDLGEKPIAPDSYIQDNNNAPKAVYEKATNKNSFSHRKKGYRSL